MQCQDSTPKGTETYPSLMSENHSLGKREDRAKISDMTESVIISIIARNVNTSAQDYVSSSHKMFVRMFSVTETWLWIKGVDTDLKRQSEEEKAHNRTILS